MGKLASIFGRPPFRFSVGRYLEKLFDAETGHDHDGTNSAAVEVGTVGAGLVGNTELATDVKVGSLATLTTTEKGSVVGALNEVDAHADSAASAAAGKYTRPPTGIPAEHLDADVRAVLAALGLNIRIGQVTLRGTATTPVGFQADTAAQLTSTEQGPYDCTGVGSGGTIIVDPDDAGEDTATLNATAGTSVSGDTPSTDISLGADNKFNISVNGAPVEEVTLTLVECDSGADIATEMETQIQALVSGQGADVTVVYTTVYTLTSPLLGTDSSVVITPALLHNVTEELKLGVAAGGTETAGGGDCADLSAVTADEIVELCSGVGGDLAWLVVSNEDEYLRLTSDTKGVGSSLVMGASTLEAVLGLAQAATAYGAQGLGYDADMPDGDYLVWLTIDGTAGAALADIAVGSATRAADGFTIECETAADASDVNVLVIGTA